METDAERLLRYRGEAAKARELAEGATGLVREQWLKVARSYDELAAALEGERRGGRQPSQRPKY